MQVLCRLGASEFKVRSEEKFVAVTKFACISTICLSQKPPRLEKRVLSRYGKEKQAKLPTGMFLFVQGGILWFDPRFLSDEPVIKNRNYDPESRTLKKRTREDDVVMQDTVEKDVEGLAQKIIKEDEQRRAQELVREYSKSTNQFSSSLPAGCVQYRTKTAELGFETRTR
jgi:hypothetical protein